MFAASWLLWTIGLLGAIGGAQAACPADDAQLLADADAAYAAYLAFDTEGFTSGQSAVREDIACLTDTLSASTAAQIHLNEALAGLLDSDSAHMLSSFRGLLAADPRYVLSADVAPTGSQPRTLFEAAGSVGAGSVTPVTQDGVIVDGKAGGRSIPNERAALVQIRSRRGGLQSWYLQGGKFPADLLRAIGAETAVSLAPEPASVPLPTISKADPLQPYTARLNQLIAALDRANAQQAKDPSGAARAQSDAVRDLTQLDLDVASLETLEDVAPLRARILVQLGEVACDHGDATSGNRALRRALMLEEDPFRKARISLRLESCVPAPVVRAPVATYAPVETWSEDEFQEEERAERAARRRTERDEEDVYEADDRYVEDLDKPEHRGGAAAVGGVILGIAGSVAILSTWAVYKNTPEMSGSEWTGLQVGNTLGWLTLGVGGVLVVSGSAHGLSVDVAPILFPGI